MYQISNLQLLTVWLMSNLLVMLLEKLELKGKKFSSFAPSTEDNIDSVWSELLIVDSTLQKDEFLTKRNLPSKQDLMAFLKHCCTRRHYSFQIKKCGSDTCDICKSVELPKEVFHSLHVLTDPVPSEDGHYKTLEELLGTETDGSHRSSLQKTYKQKKTLPFLASVQHVKNLMLQCDECSMWRLPYSRFKLTRKERADLQVAIDDISFTCGALLHDLQLPGCLSKVYTRELSCGEPIEKLYYTAKYIPICIYCADDVESVPKDKYSQCNACKDKPEIMKT